MSERLTLAEIGKRAFEVVSPGSRYRLSVPGVEVTFEVDRLERKFGELQGELEVRVGFGGTDAIDGRLSIATFNLSSARSREERATLLKSKSRSAEIPWAALIEELCQRVIIAERSGEPAVSLASVEYAREVDPTINVLGFKFARRHPSIVFGDGGVTKSLVSLYIAGLMAEEGYRVGYFDWELEVEDHRERYETLFGTSMPKAVYYARCTRPLIYEGDRLDRITRTEGLDFNIHDSIGFACHARPEDAESALAYMRTVRQIGVGSLHLAHINKSEQGDQKPFGSQFWHNSARATYFLKATDDGTVGAFCRKHNLLKFKPSPFAYEVRVDGDRTTIRQTEITTVDELAGQVPLSQRIRAYLRSGAFTREQLAAEWPDEKADTLRRTINRAIDRGTFVKFPGPDGQERIALAARGAA